MRMKMKAIPLNEIRMVRLANMRQRERDKAANAARDEKIHNLHVAIVRVEGEIASILKQAASPNRRKPQEFPAEKVSRLSTSLVQLRAELRKARGVKQEKKD